MVHRKMSRLVWRRKRDTSRITCYRCDKLGHYTLDCPDRLLRLQEAQENNSDTQDAEKLMIQEIVYLNEDMIVPRNMMPTSVERIFGTWMIVPEII